MRTLLFTFLCLIAVDLSAQCYPDRHNLTLSNSWISCTESINPNLSRGRGHWIMYDLGTTYALGQSHLWNLNLNEHQDNAIRNLTVDVSRDGSTWTEAGTYELSKATLSGFYEGEDGPDLSGHIARYVLITAIDNYGGDCVGLSEFRVQATPAANTLVSDLALDAQLTSQPNPTRTTTRITVQVANGDYTYQVTDLSGSLLLQDQIRISDGSATLQIDASTWVSGTYQFTLTDGSRTASHTIVKL